MLPRRLSCFRGSLFYPHGQHAFVLIEDKFLSSWETTEVLGERSEDASECYSDSIYGMVKEDGGAFVELLRLFRGKQS